MGKKVRFPLEMDGGIEVRSMEELRENFSLSKVLEYFESGQLVTWLRDRYVDDIADAVEQLEPADSELPRRISEIFGVPFNEKPKTDLEKAEEQAQKIKRLKEFTEEKRYLYVIDNVAFDQDELYDLLDEGKDTIYLCGERFSIPLSKAGVSYIGINQPTVVIDSKVEVDWKAKQIELEGVVFDEKYQSLLGVMNHTKEEAYGKNKAVTIPMEQLSNSGKREIIKFLAFIKKKVEEFHSSEWDDDMDDEICEDFEIDYLDPDDYNNENYEYSSKVEAKRACKEHLGSAMDDLEEAYCEARSERDEDIEGTISSIDDNISEMLDYMLEEVEDFIQDECEDETVVQMIRNLFEKVDLLKRYQDYHLNDNLKVVVERILPEEEMDIGTISEYMEFCEYDSEDDYGEKYYCFNLRDVISDMADTINDFSNSSIRQLQEALGILCGDVRDAMGVLVLKNAYEYFVHGINWVDVPSVITIDDLIDKVTNRSEVRSDISKPLRDVQDVCDSVIAEANYVINRAMDSLRDHAMGRVGKPVSPIGMIKGVGTSTTSHMESESEVEPLRIGNNADILCDIFNKIEGFIKENK